MTRQKQMGIAWCAAAATLLMVSGFPGDGRMGAEATWYVTNHWVHFLAYAGLLSIPWASWRIRIASLCCAAVGLLALSGLPHLLFGWPAQVAENLISEFFGVAAGVLLGLNLRVIRAPRGAAPSPRQGTVHSPTGVLGPQPVSRAPLTWQHNTGKEQA